MDIGLERLTLGLLFYAAKNRVAVSLNFKQRPRIVCGLTTHILQLRASPSLCGIHDSAALVIDHASPSGAKQ